MGCFILKSNGDQLSYWADTDNAFDEAERLIAGMPIGTELRIHGENGFKHGWVRIDPGAISIWRRRPFPPRAR